MKRGFIVKDLKTNDYLYVSRGDTSKPYWVDIQSATIFSKVSDVDLSLFSDITIIEVELIVNPLRVVKNIHTSNKGD